MPIVSETVLHITCDNPACPGNTLPVDDRAGWLFVNAEVYGQPGQSFVFCSAECAGTASLARAAEDTPATTPA